MFGIGLGVLVPFLLSVALVATTGDLLFTIFPLPFLGAVWALQGLSPAGYTPGGARHAARAALALAPAPVLGDPRRGPDARPIGGLLALGLNALFGSHGLRWNPRTGLHYLAITNTRDLVYLHTRRGLVVISPGRPDEFVAALARPSSRGRGEDRTVKSRVPLAVSIPQTFPAGSVDADRIRRYLARAEALGFTGAWVVEQVIGTIPSLEPIELLTYAAATTTRPAPRRRRAPHRAPEPRAHREEPRHPRPPLRRAASTWGWGSAAPPPCIPPSGSRRSAAPPASPRESGS